jgi:hypothetical protein
MSRDKIELQKLTLVKTVSFWYSIIFFLILILVLPQCITYKKHGPSSDAITNLSNLYLACSAYWADKGNDKNCTVDIASQENYGFIPSSDVAVSGNGTAISFIGRSSHINSDKSYIMDTTGSIIREK